MSVFTVSIESTYIYNVICQSVSNIVNTYIIFTTQGKWKHLKSIWKAFKRLNGLPTEDWDFEIEVFQWYVFFTLILFILN